MRDLYLFWDFKPPHVIEAIWEAYIQHVMFEHFVQRSQSNTKNQNMKIYGLITMHISEFILFVLHAKLIVKLFFITYIFFFLYKNTQTNNSFFLQAMILGH